MTKPTNFRVLVVDDNRAIHEDFAKVLATRAPDQLDDIEAMLFDSAAPVAAVTTMELVSAFQGQEALQHVIDAQRDNRPFALAFVDMRMPPGWDGLETIERIWKVDPDIQIVICSAYSDYSWNDLHQRLGDRESLLILKKPFDTIEVVQCAHALTTKWDLARRLRAHVDNLESMVAARTHELALANVLLAEQMKQRERMESELRLAQKLESVGQLAAGIAHEINTPIQYVGDNLEFLRESTLEVVGAITAIVHEATASRCAGNAALVDQLVAIVEAADIEYLAGAIPPSLDSISSGVSRIAKIVRAMKELAHPGPREAGTVDLVHALQNSLEVTASAYRHVADVETSFEPIPMVVCYGSELNQVFLNLIVNASQAMEDSRDGRPRGKLKIATRVDGDDVVISVGDSGGGIAPQHRDRVFDTFFTTKEVGRGTGQGLAISRSIVVDRHGGSLSFDTEVGVGTTFHVRIPIQGPRTRTAVAA
jgi:two-component system, NtrC family, sensor kinase